MRVPIRPLVLASLLLTPCACRPAPSSVDVAASVPRRGSPCEDLAQAFYLVALRRDRGESERAQLRAIEESLQSPFVTRDDEAREGLARVIGYVYRNPDASPGDLRRRVLAHCTTNERGEVVLGGRWAEAEGAP